MGTTSAKVTPGLLFSALVVLLGYIYHGPTSSSPSITPTVVTSQGKIHGSVLHRTDFLQPVEAFRGIPYALPPVGKLRFARPVPVPDSQTVIKALDYGFRCPGQQLLVFPGVGGGSEDCLTANVFRPANAYGAQNLPVAVYLHGGAFNRGTAKMHDTASMVSWAKPMVAVSFNYRIGALGFLNSAMTAEEGLLNLGLRDQVLLLEWVQNHIAAFGGDPDNVTLVGLSAGAHSIGHHILNRKSKFHKAIMESGGPTSRALHPYDSKLHEAQFQEFLTELQCTNLACLRQAPSANVTDASNKVFAKYNPSVRWAWQPVIDGDLVVGRSLEQVWPDIPILTGFVHNEGTMYVPRTMSTTAEFDAFFKTLLPHVTQDVGKLYPEDDYIEWRDVGEQYKRVEAAYGQYAYVCPVRQTAQLAKRVYLYHWAVNRTVMGGANHGDQMWYETMDPEVRAISETQQQIASLFHGYITDFIRTGDPNGGDRPQWTTFEAEEKTMVFGLGNDERAGGGNKGEPAQLTRDDWATEQCKFWLAQSGKYED